MHRQSGACVPGGATSGLCGKRRKKWGKNVKNGRLAVRILRILADQKPPTTVQRLQPLLLADDRGAKT